MGLIFVRVFSRSAEYCVIEWSIDVFFYVKLWIYYQIQSWFMHYRNLIIGWGLICPSLVFCTIEMWLMMYLSKLICKYFFNAYQDYIAVHFYPVIVVFSFGATSDSFVYLIMWVGNSAIMKILCGLYLLFSMLQLMSIVIWVSGNCILIIKILFGLVASYLDNYRTSLMLCMLC